MSQHHEGPKYFVKLRSNIRSGITFARKYEDHAEAAAGAGTMFSHPFIAALLSIEPHAAITFATLVGAPLFVDGTIRVIRKYSTH